MKIFQWFGKRQQAYDSKPAVMESPWGRFGISDADVLAYLNKNDGIEQNVPLQITQRLLDDAANKLVATVTDSALDLARAQGVMQGIAMVALELAKTNKAAAEKYRVAGGIMETENHER